MPLLKFCARCDGLREQGHKHRAPDKRLSASRRGYGSKWQAFAKRFLRDHPYCEDPEGCGARATQVDHLDGKGPKGPRGFDPTNCRALCASHHARRTARDQPGGFNA